MENNNATIITIETIVKADVDKVWDYFSQPEHIIKWNNASDDWHTPKAENDLRVGGKFSSRMEAKDGSFGFDFSGEYTNVEEHQLIEYKLGYERTVKIQFQPEGDATKIVESFVAETSHPEDMQRTGWQAILDNFKKYVEAN